MGGLMIPLHSQRNQQQIFRTLKTLEEIKNALLGFAVINNRLPCPASFEDGLETATCDKEGYLPWAELGVGRYDAWNNLFRYRVEEEYTENSLDKDKIFVTGSALRVKNLKDDFFTSSSDDSRVTAIIFSFGKNGKADDDNAVLDKIFIYDGYVENKDEPEKAFDDVLTWLSRNTLMNHLITAGNEEDLP